MKISLLILHVPTWMIYTIYTFYLKHEEDLKQIKIKLDILLQFNEISIFKRVVMK
jgi:hypothetical protein